MALTERSGFLSRSFDNNPIHIFGTSDRRVKYLWMALFSPSFVLGVIVLAYLLSFVLFAILRILTGISIQRIGYFSLRRISYTPKAGIEVKIRGLGLDFHRPTFAQPTWLSIVLTGLAITVDLRVTEREKKKGKGEKNCGTKRDANQQRNWRDERTYENLRSKTWQQLNAIKDSLKRLHRSVKWIKMADLVVSNSLVSLTDVGKIQIGSFSVVVDTRTRMTGQSRTRSYPKARRKQNRPAEWVITTRSILFTAESGDPVEILDHATLNIQGLLSRELDGLRDTSIALKLGRVHVPYDDVKRCIDRYQSCYNSLQKSKLLPNTGIFDQVLKNAEKIKCLEENTGEKISESADLISSILRGIREVQFVASYVGLTKRLPSTQPNGVPVYLNMSMKEVGIDLNRLDQNSPAHRMYFSSKDIAHQALVAALSIAIGLDDGNIKAERLAYIPMATTTVRTTFISKMVELSGQNSADERNANMLFANVVITSPSVDLDPRQLALVLSIMKFRPKPMENFVESRKYGLISRLLPKANVKFSMHEPVIRITLPSVEKIVQKDGFDLIISSISSVSLDIESSHSSVDDLYYSLVSTFRLKSHALYYQTFSGAHHKLMTTESFEFKTQISAKSELYVVVAGDLKTFSLHMVRPEINDGIRQIMRQIHFDVESNTEKSKRNVSDPNYIRALPAWLVNFSLQVNDFSVEVAGIDEEISDQTRGIALQLNSWTVEYHASQTEKTEVKTRRRYSRSIYSDSEIKYQRQKTQYLKPQHVTHGRKLSLQIKDLEIFIVESLQKWEQDPLIAMPKLECTFSTTSDEHGPVFNIVLYIKYLLIDYSLYRHYSCLVAVMALRRAFMQTHTNQHEAEKSKPITENFSFNNCLSPIISEESNSQDFPKSSKYAREQISIDLRATFLQIKAQMPSDPPIMLQIHNMEAGKCRWNSPFVTAKFLRLCAEAPRIRQVWAKIINIKNLRIDHRESRFAGQNGVMEAEKYFDIYAEATRIAIPHQLVVYQVVDNFVNTLKSVEQLHHRLVTGNKQVKKEKCHVEPKQFPKTLIRIKSLLFELEDGLFEWKLGVIYRTGLLEQAQRLARKAVFDLKARKVKEEIRKKLSRHTSKSSHIRDLGKDFDSDRLRSRNDEDASILSPRSQPHEYCKIRYNPDGACKITSSAEITSSEAYEKLLKFNSQSWRQRIDDAYSRTRTKMKDLRGVFWGIDELPEDINSDEEILQIPQRPALMEVFISNISINIDKPTFPLTELPNFINRIGKGMPHYMKYALLIPMHIQIDMGEARATLRDYPLPLIHVPSIKPNQSSRLPAWSLKANFVIGEEFRNNESSRNVKIEIVPPKASNKGTQGQDRFTIDIYRTISAIKSYSDITVDINTANPTHITWGSSFQPAIQDMMMTIETFTKPQIDPSDRIGFWDKIRYSFHSRVNLAWKNDGDVHLLLKGSRDPYETTGNGAGFLMCWRNSVRCDIRQCDDPKKIMTVQSGEFILAVPDFRVQAQKLLEDSCSMENESITDSFKSGTTFKKIIMKLSGNVQWLAGLMFERNLEQPGQRSFDFKPHYEIVLKRPDCAKSNGDLSYDAFRGFRSNHIHLSIAVKAPMDKEFPFSNVKRSESYNTVHLSPRFFSHFYAWWSLFGSATSLPIRQGSLWPGIDKSSKKFARHLATIKYNILLAPIFISHVYKHNDTTDFNINADSATGLKIKLENFMLDVHQRKEELETYEKEHKTQSKTSGMKMHQAQLDLISVDIRAITASIPETNSDKLNLAEGPTRVFDSEEKNPELGYFDIPENDLSWIDKDDLVELDWIRPSNKSLETKILPLTYAPRLTYFRQTDHQENHQENTYQQSPFGSEPTHFCTMTKDDDPLWEQQYELIKKRKDQLEKQMKSHNISLRDAEIRASQYAQNEKFRAEVEQLKRHSQLFRDKSNFLESMMKSFESCIPINNRLNSLEKNSFTKSKIEQPSEEKAKSSSSEEFDTELLAKSRSDFNNRFVIHNMQLKWNNLLRNIILRYIHHVSQRRGIVYYLSRRAVKFILDIVQEQKSTKDPKKDQKKQKDSKSTSFVSGHGNDPLFQNVNHHVNEFISEAKKFVDTPGKDSNSCITQNEAMDNSNLSKDFLPINSYHLHLIAPQIQLQSEKNPMAVVLVTAKGMEAKVIEIMDKDRVLDNVSGLVQRKFSVEMESIQFFVTHQKWFSSQLLSMYLGNRYGAPDDSAWPPWVPMEVMFDYEVDPFGFKRVVQKTSASLRYDKFNTLRLEYNDEVSSENNSEHKLDLKAKNRMDRVWVEFPKVHAICNSAQYYAMYIIVMDLLMYSEPLEKTRNELLEKIILASDFSDLRGVPEMIKKLQERIQQLEEIRTYFFIILNSLDEKDWEDKLLLDRDISSCENELFFMMKAITTYQRKYDTSKTSGLLRWNISSEQIIWHLMRDSNEPLLEFRLQRAEYDRTDNYDGSHNNLIQICKITGLNLLPDAIYPEILAPYLDVDGKAFSEDGNQKMLRVYWYMLEAIAGIPVMDHFSVKFFPMRIQLERDIGKKFFDYIFPGSSDTKDQSPLIVEHLEPFQNDKDENEIGLKNSPKLPEDPFNEPSTPSSGIHTETIERWLESILNSKRRQNMVSSKKTLKNMGMQPLDKQNFRLFQSHQTITPGSRILSKKVVQLSDGNRPTMKRSESFQTQLTSTSDSKTKRFALSRHNSKLKIEKSSDDLTKMMGRASSYMTFANVKINSVVLCLSYKGKSERNFEDIHNLVFRLPDLEYRNKTWSNLDLALAFKRDVIKSLISHTGAIVANKFKHRPNIAQQQRIRELASNTLILTPSSQEASLL
ncbi:hypothetical protein EPUL_002910 [Erysiphe pulchra]|uniref:FMP27 GFWDK domain-containing protein n=1 Tax=Erysiphe pulchra TaxID=225359 RepID=A0A2S4Q052_9PEZI|nr:hypothetical protein EPUL_002910 [Erysiphe pulchra]